MAAGDLPVCRRPSGDRPPARTAGSRTIRAAAWALGSTSGVWLTSYAACIALQALGVPAFSSAVAASLVTASFLAHAALLLDEDHMIELLGAAG